VGVGPDVVLAATRVLPTSGNKLSTLLTKQKELKGRNDLHDPEADAGDDIKRISMGAERIILVQER
jgi:hypothetical protein